MFLCIDAGNSQIYGGFFKDNKAINSFRLNTKLGWSSDQLGVFLSSFCREHSIDMRLVEMVAISSVVPSLDYHLNNAALKYLKCTPIFVKPGIKTGINVTKFKSHNEIGADLICSASGAVHTYPNKNLFVIDMGTASTLIAVSKDKEFLTGIIIPGLNTQISSLATSAEKLFSVEIVKPKNKIPQNTIESIQTGLYYSHIGGLKYLIKKLAKNCFDGEEYLVIGTGGYSRLFKDEELFDYLEPDLILTGLLKIIELTK